MCLVFVIHTRDKGTSGGITQELRAIGLCQEGSKVSNLYIQTGYHLGARIWRIIVSVDRLMLLGGDKINNKYLPECQRFYLSWVLY